MALQRDFTKDHRIFLREDKLLLFPIYDQTDLTEGELPALNEAGPASPADMTGKDLLWDLRRKDNTADPALIEKTSGDGISLTGTFNASQSVNTQRVAVL